jgi:hypothetical protein
LTVSRNLAVAILFDLIGMDVGRTVRVRVRFPGCHKKVLGLQTVMVVGETMSRARCIAEGE